MLTMYSEILKNSCVTYKKKKKSHVTDLVTRLKSKGVM